MDKKATVFSFTSYSFEPRRKRILFNYKTEFKDAPPLFFTETIILPKAPNLKTLPKELIEKLLTSLHLILGISYFKLYCATKVRIPYQLSKTEADFWNVAYRKGLGEFFYKNSLNPNLSPKFPHGKKVKVTPRSLEKNGHCLVGIGGGKDSIVVAELLKQHGFDIHAFSVHTGKTSELIDEVVETLGVPSLKIRRFLDRQVYQQHQYSGHIPISAIYAFLGVLLAVFYQYSYVVVGNEYSSNFGNVFYKGERINHQWSKSFEFEKLFQRYVSSTISPEVFYFSLLRPWYEIRIVKMFSAMKKYFLRFSSCNSNFKQQGAANKTRWCGQCPKCVFVFILLSAFLNKKELLKVFKKNLYQDERLLPLFKNVLGLGAMKPFDCVGTFEEAQTALHLARKKFRDEFIVRQLDEKVAYYPEVFKSQRQSNLPEPLKLLGAKHVLVLGYGKEGRVTKQYLKKYYPRLKVGVADMTQGKHYLRKQKDFDVAIKTPGIKKELVPIPYTTATNIFFSKVLGKYLIIGVTGSKGKSTTASLIFHILKKAGKPVQLLGNIGKPMLGALLHPVKTGTIFILELSSYQLDDLKFSPDIAVVTSLFPEHMDYHKGTKNYYQAKKNIIRFQGKHHYFVYNPENKQTVGWLKDYRGKAIPFAKKMIVKTALMGSHNQDNMRAAFAVAKILNISEDKIKKAIASFKPLPHRLELVGTFRGITFYDDANAATPEATIMAIKTLERVDTIFLGGEDRGYDFSQLEKTLKKYRIKNIVLFPESGKRMLSSKKGLTILKTSSMKEAVAFAYQHTKPGSVCLLSCASPSYSLWENFEEKGDEFKKWVKHFGK